MSRVNVQFCLNLTWYQKTMNFTQHDLSILNSYSPVKAWPMQTSPCHQTWPPTSEKHEPMSFGLAAAFNSANVKWDLSLEAKQIHSKHFKCESFVFLAFQLDVRLSDMISYSCFALHNSCASVGKKSLRFLLWRPVLLWERRSIAALVLWLLPLLCCWLQ